MTAQTQDYRTHLEELDNMTQVLSMHPGKIGFVHKFIVPGIIGWVQEQIIEGKMNVEAQKNIYKDLNYYECGNKIIELTKILCEKRYNSTEIIDKDLENPINTEILESVGSAIEKWGRIYPEIANWPNQEFEKDLKISPLGVIQIRTNHALCSIMDLPRERANRPKKTFLQGLKEDGYWALSMFINIILFAIIVGLIRAIFG